MTDITITVNTIDPADLRAVTNEFTKTNAERQAIGMPQFATTKEFVEWYLIFRVIPTWRTVEQNESLENVKQRWRMATDAERQAALNQLPPLP